MREPDDRFEDEGENQTTTGRVRAWLERVLGGRPLSVYGVLAAGVAVLVILLGIIVITATGGPDNPGTPLCVQTNADDARLLVYRGQVRQIDVVTVPERPNVSVGVRLESVDDTCYELPQGLANQAAHEAVLGAAQLYNNGRSADERVRVRFPEQQVPAELLATATPTPVATATATVPPTVPPASPTAEPPTATPEPTATPSPTMTATATATASANVASPGVDLLPGLQTATPFRPAP